MFLNQKLIEFIIKFIWVSYFLIFISCDFNKKENESKIKNSENEGLASIEEQATNKLFSELTIASVDTAYNALFGYDETKVRYIDIDCSKLSPNTPYYCTDSVLAPWKVIAKFKDSKIKDSLFVLFTTGMSDDPGFAIGLPTGKIVGDFSCAEFYIDKNGSIYTAGHINNMYNRKRKFHISQDTVLEVKQPYNYVGLKGKLKKDIFLFHEKSGGGIVCQLKKGEDIEILLAESSTRDYDIDRVFLARNNFGLVGCIRIQDDIYKTILDDLYYAGD